MHTGVKAQLKASTVIEESQHAFSQVSISDRQSHRPGGNDIIFSIQRGGATSPLRPTLLSPCQQGNMSQTG